MSNNNNETPSSNTSSTDSGALSSEDGHHETSRSDPLLESLLYIANSEDLHASHASMVSGLPLVDGKLTPELYIKAADRVGLKAAVVERDLLAISDLVLPVVLLLESNNAVVLLQLYRDENMAQVYLPLTGETSELPLDKLLSQYTGYSIFSVLKPRIEQNTDTVITPTYKHWFWGTLTNSWQIYRDVLIASLIINIFVIANPLFVMNVYDRVVPNAAIETLWALAIGIIFLYGFDFALKLLRNYFIEIAGKKSDILLSSFILQKILGARFESHPKSVGAFVSHLREFETVRNFITSTTITTFIDLPFVFFFLIVVAYIAGSVAWVPLIFIPLILIYSWFVHYRLKRDVTESFLASAQKNATLVEAITQLESVKVLNAEGTILRKWNSAVGQLAQWGLAARVLSNSATSFAAFAQQLASVFVIIVGVYLIAERELTQGALIASVILCGRILAPFAQVSGLLVQYYQSKLALDSLDELVNKPQEHDPNVRFLQKPLLSGDIAIEDVTFAYPDETHASLKNVSIQINAGECVAIIGKMGSGKTTLQKLLLGLYRPQSGHILFNGVDISQFNPADLRDQIGYVSQESELFAGSIRDNIMFGHTGYDDKELLRVAAITGINTWINTHPNAYERHVGERGALLSGGQKQAIAIARALVGDPSILMMDEPSSSMDNASEAAMINALKAHLEGKTLILVTHKISMLGLAERLVVVDSGSIVADGKKEMVLDALKKGRLHVSD